MKQTKNVLAVLTQIAMIVMMIIRFVLVVEI